MDVNTLLSIGFDVSGGMIDRLGKNYGFLSKDGPVLTPEGEALAASLQAPVEPQKRPRKKAEPVIEQDGPDEAALDAMLKE
jgi:hypothetical protein